MNVEYKRVDLRSIDLTDTTFVISYGFSLSILRESIERVGVLNPPLVKRSIHGRYRVVCGYKRLMVCREMGTEELTCALLDYNTDEREAFLIGLYDNLSHRNLNPIERSIAASKLQDYYPDRVIVEDFLSLLGLNTHLSVLQRVLPLSHLYGEMKDAIVEGRLDEGAALRLLDLSERDRQLVFRLVYDLRLSKNKQIEVIDSLRDITRRDDCSVSGILDSTGMKRILKDKDLNIPQKARRVRRFIRKLRYPAIVRAEEGFLEMTRTLNLGDGIRLAPPPSFEGDRYSIDFQFVTIDELERKLKQIDSIKDNKGLRKAVEG